jgi:hypothetical protein
MIGYIVSACQWVELQPAWEWQFMLAVFGLASLWCAISIIVAHPRRRHRMPKPATEMRKVYAMFKENNQ